MSLCYVYNFSCCNFLFLITSSEETQSNWNVILNFDKSLTSFVFLLQRRLKKFPTDLQNNWASLGLVIWQIRSFHRGERNGVIKMLTKKVRFVRNQTLSQFICWLWFILFLQALISRSWLTFFGHCVFSEAISGWLLLFRIVEIHQIS